MPVSNQNGELSVRTPCFTDKVTDIVLSKLHISRGKVVEAAGVEAESAASNPRKLRQNSKTCTRLHCSWITCFAACYAGASFCGHGVYVWTRASQNRSLPPSAAIAFRKHRKNTAALTAHDWPRCGRVSGRKVDFGMEVVS